MSGCVWCAASCLGPGDDDEGVVCVRPRHERIELRLELRVAGFDAGAVHIVHEVRDDERDVGQRIARSNAARGAFSHRGSSLRSGRPG